MPLLRVGTGRSLLRAPSAAAAAWSPPDLGSALRGWYKADVGLTLSGSDVTAWADQSGNGHNLGIGVSPVYNATGLNGKPAVVFTAAGATALQSTANTFALGAGTTLSVFALAEMLTGTSNYGRFVSYYGNGLSGGNDYDNTASAAVILRVGTNNEFGTYRNSVQQLAQAISLATTYRFGTIYDGTRVTPYLNGAAGTDAANTMSFTSPGTIGLGAGGGSYWSGAVREIIITNSALSSGDRTSLDAYLVSRS